MKKIKILGTDYEILTRSEQDTTKFEEANGICEFFAKKILVDTDHSGRLVYENIEAFDRKVLRHEIIHAFFGESGMTGYMEDEALVDWLAVQFPKIEKVFKSLGIEED